MSEALLNELMGGDPISSAPKVRAPYSNAPTMGKLQRVHYTHDAMIDLIIANPGIHQNQIAAHFGYTVGWISQIVSSDAFQAKLAERRDEVIDPILRASVREQFEGLVSRSLQVLREKLDKPAEMIPDNLALRALEITSRAAGYGAKDTKVNVDVDMNVHLEDLGGNLAKLLQRRKAEVIDAGDLPE